MTVFNYFIRLGRCENSGACLDSRDLLAKPHGAAAVNRRIGRRHLPGERNCFILQRDQSHVQLPSCRKYHFVGNGFADDDGCRVDG